MGGILSPFGLACRQHRMKLGRVMAHQAEFLGCSVSFVSAIEIGEKPIPDDYPRRIAAWFGLDQVAQDQLCELAIAEKRVIKITPTDGEKAIIAHDLARLVNEASVEKLARVREILRAEMRNGEAQ